MNQRYTHRNRKLLDLAHQINECQIQIPGVCTGYSPEGCEPAHSNQQRHGKGVGRKSHDIFHAAGCHACHMEIDQMNRLPREAKEHYWREGFERTLLEYFKRGLLVVMK